jgi:hypothetical protein
MFRWINKMIASKYKKEQKPRAYKPLEQESLYRFSNKGDGLFVCNFKGTSNSFVAKVIQYFSGNLTHSFIVLYSNDMRSWFTSEQWEKLSKKYNYYYGVTTGIPLSTKTLVLGSADQDGINILDYSKYQNRMQSIRKVPINSVAIKAVIGWLCRDKVLNANYDYSGLVTQPLHEILPFMDVKDDFYCSELCYDAFDSVGVKIAKKADPSPKDIEDYHKEWIVFSTL